MIMLALIVLFCTLLFISAFIVRQAILFILKKWNGGIFRLVIANVMSLLFLCSINGCTSNNSRFDFQLAFFIFSPFQAICLLRDIFQFYLPEPANEAVRAERIRIFRYAKFVLVAVPLSCLGFAVLTIVEACNRNFGNAYDMAVPNDDTAIRLRRTATHAFLAEYDRTLILLRNGREVARFKMPPDTGGTSLLHVYRMDRDAIRLVDRFSVYDVALATGNITETRVPEAGPVGGELLGAFDKIPGPDHEYRFISVSERPVRPIDYSR